MKFGGLKVFCASNGMNLITNYETMNMSTNSLEAVFSTIYKTNIWGDSKDHKFYSGSGSHDPKITAPYIQALSTFMVYFTMITGKKPIVVDVGCGDFAIGSKISNYTEKYIGADIVKELIEHNQSVYADNCRSFIHLDISSEAPPRGDICIVRQVFQHLPNSAIQAALNNIIPNCDYLVLTEHLPNGNDFTPNLEIPHPGSWRLSIQSGVDITKSPFNQNLSMSLPIHEIDEYGGVIKTIIYKK